MRATSRHIAAAAVAAGFLVVTVTMAEPATPAMANGVGDASWTPATTTTTARASTFMVPDDAFTLVTDAHWTPAQVEGLERYTSDGLRYTHEVNDRSGRLSATGFWATNYPDPAFDRDDDDGDGRWEETEITVGPSLSASGGDYRSIIQLSRWHGVGRRTGCDWSWDLRAGEADVLSQLSRDALGEWQALHYTQSYEQAGYDRSGPRPTLPSGSPAPQCGAATAAAAAQEGVVVTFDRPIGWDALLALTSTGGRWTAFEAIGRGPGDERVWTCGGPVLDGRPGLETCRGLDVRPEGVTAAGGYFDADTVMRLRSSDDVARVSVWRDGLTDFLAGVAGLDVQPPDLTLNDAYWSLFLR